MAFNVEQLFDAVKIIAESSISNLSFDKTIICTIVDDSDKKNGHYIVSDGTIQFDAYVNDATYSTNEQVRVSILNGDFANKKFIVGKYTSDEYTSPITYKSPLEAIVPITGNLVSIDKKVPTSLRANSSTREKVLWSTNLSSNKAFRDLQSNGIYNTLTIKADFKTLLSNYDLRAGNYGLRLDLLIQPTFDSNQRIRKYIALDSSEMFGNPYSFSVYSTQAKKVDIVSMGVIAEMVLWMYQGQNADGTDSYFIDASGQRMPENQFDDIIARNIEIGFGSNLEKIADNTITLYTTSTPEYKHNSPTEETNRKSVELLWYNKTENNDYIGFSDGVVVFENDKVKLYDEIDYLKRSHTDSRLVAQMGRENIPTDYYGLKLAADAQDVNPIMVKARDALTKDVRSVLVSLRNSVQGVTTFTQKVNELLNESTGALMTGYRNASMALDSFNNAYNGVLKYVYDIQNSVTSPSVWPTEWVSADYGSNYLNSITTTIQSIRNFFISMYQDTDPTTGQLSGYRGVYDTYNFRMEKELDIIEKYLKQIEKTLQGNYDILKNYETITKNNIIVYEKKIFTEDANRYCIYWYRYERGYKLEYDQTPGADNSEYEFGKFLPDGWHRIREYDNIGLPQISSVDDCTLIDGKYYYPPRALDQAILPYADPNTREEKYMAVLFHNHEMYKPLEPIQFTNSEDFDSGLLTDKQDALHIEHHTQSFDHYQSYDSYGTLLHLEDGSKVRQLRCLYDGLFQGDEALIDAGIYWYVPNNSSMLRVDIADLKKRGFSTDADGPTEYTRQGFTYFYKKIAKCSDADRLTNDYGELYYTCNDADRYFFYMIQPTYDKTATRNTIEVWAYLPGLDDPVKGDVAFTFSTFGSNGTKYTLSITPATSQIAVVGTQALPLSVKLRDSAGNSIDIVQSINLDGDPNAAYGFTPTWFGPTTYVASVNPATGPVTGLNISRDTRYNANKYFYGILNAQTKFKIQTNEDDAAVEKVPEYQKHQVVTLNTLYPIPYSSSGMYYISGPTTIVYNTQGTVSQMREDPFCLYQVNDKENKPVDGQQWKLEYYDKDGNWITSSHKDWGMLRNYMPVLNSEKGLTPAPLYMNDLPYYPVAICTVNNNVAWVQPIVITQNRYDSSTLNDWNGSLTIDEKNGTILSTAMGAGKKEEDNSFSGVLMGDIGRGMNFDLENSSGLGIYGFNKGAQSFNFSIDGTAFLGKAGRGRIKFDGNSGTITSASYEQLKTTGDSGMLIDLDDGIIDMYGVEPIGIDKGQSNSYRIGDTHPHIRLSTTASAGNPYFLISTPNIDNNSKWNDKELIYIGLDEYYLQSENYESGSYSTQDGVSNAPGQGMRINLKQGAIDAYNLLITSKNIYIDSTEDATSFFIIKDNDGCNLIHAGEDDFSIQSHTYSRYSAGDRLTDGNGKQYFYPGMKFSTWYDETQSEYKFLFDVRGNYQSVFKISQEEFYLQTDNYKPRVANASGITTDYGSGIQIDLRDGSIDAYDFILRGESSSGATAGSYILLDSVTPQFIVHLNLPQSEDTSLDLLNISPDNFIMHSANWVQSSKTETIPATATTIAGYNVRTGPGTNYSIVGTTGSGKIVPIYEGPTAGQGATNWYRIGDGQWVAGSALYNFASGGTAIKTFGTGMEFDLNNGKITAYNSENAGRALSIDSESDYPIQAGSIDNYNLKFGWDGSIHGGSTYDWTIGADGTATFNRLNSNGGSLSWCYIYDATMSSTNVTDSFTFGGESYKPSNFKINFAQWGYYAGGVSSVTVLTTATEATTTASGTIKGNTSAVGGSNSTSYSTGSAGTISHTHTFYLPYHSHSFSFDAADLVLETKLKDATNLWLYNKDFSGRILATGDISITSGAN